MASKRDLSFKAVEMSLIAAAMVDGGLCRSEDIA